MKQIINNILAISIFVLSMQADCILADVRIELQSIKSTQISGGQVQVSLKFSGQPGLPTGFSMDSPSQIVFDFKGVSNKLQKSDTLKKLSSGVIKEINFVEGDDKTRMIVGVMRIVPFQTERDGNNITITFASDTQLSAGQDNNAAALSAPAVTNNAIPTMIDSDCVAVLNEEECCATDCEKINVVGQPEQNQLANNYNIKAIDFRRGEEGEGRLIIDLASEAAPIDFHEIDNEMVLEYKGATIAEKLLRRFDVSDFGTPIKRVVVSRQNETVFFKIQAVGEYDKVAYQVDNQYVVEVKPMNSQVKDAAKMQKFKFTGERISLNFQNIEVRAVLQLLADFTGLNIIASDSVAGNVTLRLDNVPWDQALDFILKSKGLGKRASGNIVLIAPNEEIAAREQLELETIKQAEILAPLQSEYVQINYAKAGDIEQMLKTDGNSVLSERGVISVDERTNTLLIKDTSDKLAEIEKIVEKLDVPIRQVLIEAQVVQTKDNFLDVFGVNLGGATKFQGGKHYTIGMGGDLNAAHRIAKRNAITDTYQADTGTTTTTTLTAAGGNPVTAVTTQQNAGNPNDNLKFFDLAQADAAGKLGLAIARLPGGTLLDLELRASELEDKSKVLARPKLMTLDQQTASIESGEEIPYSTVSQSGSTPTVTFKKAVLKLEVTPQITPNNKVLMELAITQDKPGNTYNGGKGIDTTNLKTNILVDNGETVVLGGIFKVDHGKKITRIPWLSDIPFLGRFFRDHYESNNRQEILIFVTPKIIKAASQN